MKSFDIVPAIMPKGYLDLVDKINLVAGSVESVQLDLMDGVFVPEKTWPYMVPVEGDIDDMGRLYFDMLIGGEAGLPMMDSIDFELDLMVQKPEENLEMWFALQPSRIVFHFESIEDMPALIEGLKPVREIIEVGISFDDDFSVEALLENTIDQFDFVQVMGIDEIGSSGQEFEERVLHNIRGISDRFPGKTISVDGSVNRETITRLRDAGASRFVAGSAIYGKGIAIDNVDYLSNLVSGGSAL